MVELNPHFSICRIRIRIGSGSVSVQDSFLLECSKKNYYALLFLKYGPETLLSTCEGFSLESLYSVRYSPRVDLYTLCHTDPALGIFRCQDPDSDPDLHHPATWSLY